MRRYNQNTLVVGDRIKFVDSYKSHDWYQKQGAVTHERLAEFLESGDNIRISAVKSLRPSTAQTGHFEIVDDYYYDVVREAAPGFYSQVFTVPANIVEWLDDYPNLAGETPASQKRDDTTQINPSEFDPAHPDANMSLKKQTGTGEGDRSLGSANVKLDNTPSVTDGESYTKQYIK
jgi:hypothetical protein